MVNLEAVLKAYFSSFDICLGNTKDTWRSLCAADEVETRSDDVGRLAAAGQVFGERHLVEVERRVQTVFVHLQLVTQSVDAVSRCRDTRITKSKSVYRNNTTILDITQYPQNCCF